jgi:hypothetical protein
MAPTKQEEKQNRRINQTESEKSLERTMGGQNQQRISRGVKEANRTESNRLLTGNKVTKKSLDRFLQRIHRRFTQKVGLIALHNRRSD